jgi:outer membrane protein assembly factor BamA
MSAGQPFMTRNLLKAIVAGLLITLSFSCVVVKKYQPNKPFVYKTNINLIGNFSKDTADQLISGLYNQLDDSLRPRRISQVYRSIQRNPPLYDAANADKSIIFMKSLLNSLGYFNDSIAYDTVVNIPPRKADQYQTTVTFHVKPGKQVKLDSIWYNLRQAELQKLTLANQKESLLKKGEAFSKGPISGELDRLVEIYRDNGYLRFNREELIGVWDTVDVDLLRPSIDPFEQLDILRKLAERRQNPTANLEIRLRPNYDTSKLIKYYIGTVNIYPDFTPDTIGRVRESIQVAEDMYVIQHGNKFKPRIFPINIYLKHDSLYRQRRYQRTINRLNSIGTWRLINVKAFPRPGQDTVDFNIELTPSDKYVFNANVEASQNQTAISGNLFGIGVNVGVQNRNLWKAANQSSLNFRYSVELGSKFIQTQQASISYNIYFPRPIPAFKNWLPERLRDNVRTVFSFNASNTERRELFNLTVVNGSWGYEFNQNLVRRNRAVQVTWKIPNIEYSYLRERDSLKRLIEKNPSLKNIFTDGFVSTTLIGVNLASTRAKKPNVLSFNLELPFVAQWIQSNFLDTHLYRFIKFNTEFTQAFKFSKSTVVLHAFGGVGYEFNSTKNPFKRNNLPFFKEYFAGGPNSMRAWRLRRLGPGSAVKSFAKDPERYGDVQLEFNIEYRFVLANIAGVGRLESVLFTDIGNIWFLKKEAGATPEEVFSFSRLPKDLAIGVGTGLRFDFTYFLVRLDYAFKMKDPSPEDAAGQNKLFYKFNPLDGQLQIGINYPFKL